MMRLSTLKTLLGTLGASGLLAGADLPRPPAIPSGDVVILQGRFANGRIRPWTVYQNGVSRDLGPSEYFQLPRDLDLVILQATFTVKGACPAARTAHFQITSRNGLGTFPLARCTARLKPQVSMNSVSRSFATGLPLAAGSELKAGYGELGPGTIPPPVEVLLYGYWVRPAR
jgi:hypothetical protein